MKSNKDAVGNLLKLKNIIVKNFAGFVITYERPEIVAGTIQKLFNQSLAPEKILVIDNSESTKTEKVVAGLNDSRIQYYRVGQNVGPAGGAAIGLEHLALEGYNWIFWGDDNDPPKFEIEFEKLLEVAMKRNPGVIGAVGHLFNKYTGIIERIPSDCLKGIMNVNTIAGGDCMIVNGEVVRRGIIPDKRLFFGFEEFDFCYRVKKAGYEILVDGDLFYQYREQSGNLNKKRKLMNLKTSSISLSREYYSKRNLFFILKKNHLYLAFASVLVRSLIKAFINFKTGFRIGIINGKLLVKSIGDGLLNRMGKTINIG